jgi:hypothetical protein
MGKMFLVVDSFNDNISLGIVLGYAGVFGK